MARDLVDRLETTIDEFLLAVNRDGFYDGERSVIYPSAEVIGGGGFGLHLGSRNPFGEIEGGDKLRALEAATHAMIMEMHQVQLMEGRMPLTILKNTRRPGGELYLLDKLQSCLGEYFLLRGLL